MSSQRCIVFGRPIPHLEESCEVMSPGSIILNVPFKIKKVYSGVFSTYAYFTTETNECLYFPVLRPQYLFYAVPFFNNVKINHIACGSNSTIFWLEQPIKRTTNASLEPAASASGALLSPSSSSAPQNEANNASSNASSHVVVEEEELLPYANLTVFGSGSNLDEELGIQGSFNLEVDQPVPLNHLNGSDIKQISAGSFHTAVLKKDGTVWTAGSNRDFQLGFDNEQNTHTEHRMIPIEKFGNEKVAKIDCGSLHTVMLTESGKLYVCGYNQNGEIANSNLTRIPLSPFDIGAFPYKITSVFCGTFQTFVKTSFDKLYFRGLNENLVLSSLIDSSQQWLCYYDFTEMTRFPQWTQIMCNQAYALVVQKKQLSGFGSVQLDYKLARYERLKSVSVAFNWFFIVLEDVVSLFDVKFMQEQALPFTNVTIETTQ